MVAEQAALSERSKASVESTSAINENILGGTSVRSGSET